MPPYIERDPNYDRPSRDRSVVIGGIAAVVLTGIGLVVLAEAGNVYAQIGLVVLTAILLMAGYLAATAKVAGSSTTYDDQEHCTDDPERERRRSRPAS